MVRRLSVASLDSGAELTVYGEEPSASTDRVNLTAKSPSVGGGRRAVQNGAGNPAELGGPGHRYVRHLDREMDQEPGSLGWLF